MYEVKYKPCEGARTLTRYFYTIEELQAFTTTNKSIILISYKRIGE